MNRGIFVRIVLVRTVKSILLKIRAPYVFELYVITRHAVYSCQDHVLCSIRASHFRIKIYYAAYVDSPLTHVKISQLVATLQTSRQQIVFARLNCSKLSTSLEQSINNL